MHEFTRPPFNNDFRGPPLMMTDVCTTTLIQGCLFENGIYAEKFLLAADAQQMRSPLFPKR